MTETTNSQSKDMALLFSAMNSLKDGNYQNVDTSVFDDPSVGEAYNEMLKGVIDRNNALLARINDAQSRIADSSCVKVMFEQIEFQQKASNLLNQTSEDIGTSLDEFQGIGAEILDLSRQISNSLAPCTQDLSASLEILSRVSDNPESVSADEAKLLHSIISRCLDTQSGMSRRIKIITNDVDAIFERLDSETETIRKFMKNADDITSSFSELYVECVETGKHLYRISRDVDNARNDLFRHNSRPTVHDSLRIFEVDHLTLAWRLYNHIVEFETLRLDQVNNPEGCKFGLWCSNQTNPYIIEAPEFNRAFEFHQLFHERAIECYNAKQKGNIPKALEEFTKALDYSEQFRKALQDLHKALTAVGITDETPLWVFKG